MQTFNSDNVWLLIEDDDDEASYEANIVPDDDGYQVEWYHTAVGQVSREWFADVDAAEAWLTEAGYQDFSS